MPPTMTKLHSWRRRLFLANHSASPVRFLTWSSRAMEKRTGFPLSYACPQ